MTRFHLLVLGLFLSLKPASALAGHKGSISFTEEERSRHETGQETILRTAASCLKRDIDHHLAFFRRHGIAAFYGDRSSFGKLSTAQKREYLRQLGKNPNLVSQLAPTSCVGITLKCLGAGFEAAGQADLWARLRQFTVSNGVDGTALQKGLQALGWKVLYWNPDVRYNLQWDRDERAKNPSNSDRFWGNHEANWRNVQRSGTYVFNRVDDIRLLASFGATVPSLLKPIPFFVGTAHGGYHVFPGTYGRVIEAHSTRRINDPKTLETDQFNPLAGKAPTNGTYHSGMIAIPARYMP